MGCDVTHPEPGTLARPAASPRFQAGPAREAYAAYVECSRLQGQGAPAREIEETIARAVELAPTEAAYRFIAAGFALHRGDMTTGTTTMTAAIDGSCTKAPL